MRGQGTATFKNNMVRLGLDASGKSITSPFSIIGIRDIVGATANYYFNSVYIGGTGVTTGANTFAFFSDVVNNTRVFEDNIFWNARSNTTAGGTVHVAITVGGTAPNPPGLTSNYNDLYATGTDGVVGVFNNLLQPTLANWQTATRARMPTASPSTRCNINPNGNAVTGDIISSRPVHALGRALSSLASPTILTAIRGSIRPRSAPTSRPELQRLHLRLQLQQPRPQRRPRPRLAQWRLRQRQPLHSRLHPLQPRQLRLQLQPQQHQAAHRITHSHRGKER